MSALDFETVSSNSTSKNGLLKNVGQNDIDTIAELSQKIQEVKLQRLKLNPMRKFNEVKNKSKSKSSRKISSRRRLYHPNLDSVFINVANSPYLTGPGDEYSKDTIRASNTLRQLGGIGKELKKISDLPFDIRKSKETFVEALTYSPSFEVLPSKKNSKSLSFSLSTTSISSVASMENTSIADDQTLTPKNIGGMEVVKGMVNNRPPSTKSLKSSKTEQGVIAKKNTISSLSESSQCKNKINEDSSGGKKHSRQMIISDNNEIPSRQASCPAVMATSGDSKMTLNETMHLIKRRSSLDDKETRKKLEFYSSLVTYSGDASDTKSNNNMECTTTREPSVMEGTACSSNMESADDANPIRTKRKTSLDEGDTRQKLEFYASIVTHSEDVKCEHNYLNDL